MRAPAISLAVLPFDPLPADETAGLFARGIAEELIASLTRFRPLRVIAAESALGLAGAGRSLEEVAQEWGVDFVLEGSVRRGDDRLRITARLRPARAQETVWSERFDAPMEDLLAVQEQIAATVAGRLAVQLGGFAADRSGPGPGPEAYLLWLRGMDCLHRATLEGDAEARGWFRQALDRDPGLARAHAGLSLSHFNEWSCQAWHLWDESAEGALTHARKAAELDPADALVQAVLARVHRYRHEHDRADAHVQRALQLNDNDAPVLIQTAVATLFGGDPAEARRLAEKAIHYNPLHGAWFAGMVGWCLFQEGRPEEALDWLSLGGEEVTNFAAYRAACHVLLGDREAAQSAYRDFERQYEEKIAFGRAPEPGEALTWAVQVEPFRRLEDARRMPDALRDAGLATVDVADVRKCRTSALVRPAGIPRPTGNAFRREGRVWTMDHAGTGARLVELKGFHDIARLLAEPEVPVHCLELTGAAELARGTQEVLDPEARQAYRRRIEELQAELEQAEAHHDEARTTPLREELEQVMEELVRATGLGGRGRAMGSRVERARSAVTWRIRSAIQKIRAAHPELGRHLEHSIRTGTFCRYAPEHPLVWQL